MKYGFASQLNSNTYTKSQARRPARTAIEQEPCKAPVPAIVGAAE